MTSLEEADSVVDSGEASAVDLETWEVVLEDLEACKASATLKISLVEAECKVSLPFSQALSQVVLVQLQ